MLASPFPIAFAVALTAFVCGLLFLFWRRQLGQEVRSIVQGLEALRSGQTEGRPDVRGRSPLSLVSDAVHRLGVQFRGRRSEVQAEADRWRALSNATRDTAIITMDTDGDIRSFSAGATLLMGWDESEVVSRPGSMLFEVAAYKELLPQLARRSLRTRGITARSKLLRRDGSEFEADVSVRLLIGGSERPSGFLLVVRDVTEHIRMENELRRSEQRYRGLVEGLTEGVIIIRAGRLIYANSAAAELCGGEARELPGTVWRDRIATGDVLVVESALAEIEAGGSSGKTLRCSLVGPDGVRRADVRIRADSVNYEGEPAVLLLVQDETAERLLVRELRRNEARLDAVLEATSDGILVLAENRGAGMVQMTNRASPDVEVQTILADLEIVIIVRRATELLGHPAIPVEYAHGLHAGWSELGNVAILNLRYQGLRRTPAQLANGWCGKRHTEEGRDLAILDIHPGQRFTSTINHRSAIAADQRQ